MFLLVNFLFLKSAAKRFFGVFVDQVYKPLCHCFKVLAAAKVFVVLFVRARVLDQLFEVPPCKVLLG